MAKDYIGYQALLDAALRGVVRDALLRIEKQGLIGSHHFYLTFKTGFPGVDIPSFLVEQYPDEMTIILQHQFWGLKIRDEDFEVALTFRKLPATLVIPFAALTKFFDPGVPFGLEFKSVEDGPAAKPVPKAVPPQSDATLLPHKVEAQPETDGAEKPEGEKPEAEKPAGAGEVVSLDSFRKK
ncbi:MAG: ClpXP protease specificity-enhancing factor SspB [Rhizomicrobium sp.]|nr:ClpXP protease specificity-enhancing factor SspB [Rhizomicrobium sp.]